MKQLKELMSYAGKYKYLTYASIIIGGISAILSTIPFVFIWFIIKEAIEVMPNFENATNMVHNGWQALSAQLISIFVYLVALLLSHKAAFRVASQIKIKCMKHILKMPIGKVNDIGSGKLRKQVIESANSTEDFLAHKLVDMSVAIVTPICMIVLLFVFDWKLGLVSLLPIALSFIAMSKMMGPYMAKDMKEYQNAMEEMNAQAVEYVRGMPVVKTFGQTIFTFKKFKNSIDNYEKFCTSYTEKSRKSMLKFIVYENSVFAFLTAITILVSAKGTITSQFILNLIFYIIYTPIITTTLTKIMFVGEQILTINDSLDRINGILKIESLREGREGGKVKNNSIELENVKFAYENSTQNAIDGVSLKIPENSLVAFVGPSGGGKSSLANLITRFYDVNSGSIKIGGTDIRDIKKEELSNLVSFVFQDSKLIKGSILENVKMANPKATNKEVREALKLAQCDDILEKLPDGINTIYGSKGVYLSGGEMQRINIARVILKNSPIVILDEATAFADPENEAKVQKAFENISKNKTVIMIAHRLSSIVNADKIYVLQNGKIIEEGKHKELIEQKGLFSKMWKDYQTSISWKVGV